MVDGLLSPFALVLLCRTSFVSLSLTTADPQEKYVDGIARKLLSRAVTGCGILVKAVVSAAYCVQNSKIGWLVYPQYMSNHIDTVTS